MLGPLQLLSFFHSPNQEFCMYNRSKQWANFMQRRCVQMQTSERSNCYIKLHPWQASDKTVTTLTWECHVTFFQCRQCFANNKCVFEWQLVTTFPSDFLSHLFSIQLLSRIKKTIRDNISPLINIQIYLHPSLPSLFYSLSCAYLVLGCHFSWCIFLKGWNYWIKVTFFRPKKLSQLVTKKCCF